MYPLRSPRYVSGGCGCTGRRRDDAGTGLSHGRPHDRESVQSVRSDHKDIECGHCTSGKSSGGSEKKKK